MSKVLSIATLSLSLPVAARLPGHRGASLARRFRPGQSMVYDTRFEAKASIETDPAGLAAFLPPIPTQLSGSQQATVAVRNVDESGSAEVDNHFDSFSLDSNLADRAPVPLRDSLRQDQQKLVKRVEGLKLVAHYDSKGRLIDFSGADAALEQLAVPLRAPTREGLRFFLQQISGNALDPGKAVEVGDQWSRDFSTPPTESFPWGIEGKTTWHFAGETRYGKTRAAIIDYTFEDHLNASAAGGKLPAFGPLAGMAANPAHGLDVKLRGGGQGRALVATDDGRVLQNEVHTHQTLAATLRGVKRGSEPEPKPISVNIQGEAGVEMKSK